MSTPENPHMAITSGETLYSIERLDEANVELGNVVGLSLRVHDEDEEDDFNDEGSLSRT